MIEVRNLSKSYRVHKRAPGLAAALRSVFRRRYETVKAVEDLSFQIAEGERVGFLGPNGAGKTTTLKVLSGLLHPTSGDVRVGSYVPHTREPRFLKLITLVMGQKQQLLWDLPPSETYAMNRAIYDVPRAQSDETVRTLTELLELGDLIDKPTRQLSLGERMKCELAAALLHRPRVLFLDEPTIGLDVSMQAKMRDFIRDYNERYGATVLLTSHYMDDVVGAVPAGHRHRHGPPDLRRRPARAGAPRPPRQARHHPAVEAGRTGPTWTRLGTVVSRGRRAGGAVRAGRAGERRRARRARDAADRRPHHRGPAARGGDARAVPARGREQPAAAGPAIPGARVSAVNAAPPRPRRPSWPRRAGFPDAAAHRRRRGGGLPRRVPGLDPHHEHAAGHAGAVDAVAADGPVGRFDQRQFIAYYLGVLVVRLADQHLDGLADDDGDPRRHAVGELLRPIHPLFAYAAEHLAAIPMRILVVSPIVAVLVATSWDRLARHDPSLVVVLLASLVGAWLLMFFSMVLLGSLAFFVDSAMGVFELWIGVHASSRAT